MSEVIETKFTDYSKSVLKVLKALKPDFKSQERIILKPNLTLADPPPTTTDVRCTEAVLKYCQENFKGEVIIAEGSGGCDTSKSFEGLGYYKLGKKYGVEVIDLNRAERVLVEKKSALKLKKFYIPEVLKKGYLINIPVIKDHSAAVSTISMKNLFGIYQSSAVFRLSGWSKAKLHHYGVHESIYDLNLYRKIDLTIVDAAIGMCKREVGGDPISPPIGLIIGGFDPVSVDAYCSTLLGHDPKEIKYLQYADGKLGEIEFKVKKV